MENVQKLECKDKS